MDEELRAVLLLVIENAILPNIHAGTEQCLYCSWQRAFIPFEEMKRIEKMPQEERDAWWATIQAQNQHDEECIVTRIRQRLKLPNPRAIYTD